MNRRRARRRNVLLACLLLRDLDKTSHLKEDLTAWPPKGSTFDAPLPFSIPSMVRVAIVARIARMSEAANTVVRAASVSGVSVDLDLTIHLTGLSRTAVEAALDELERYRLVVHTGNRYVFNGRLLPEVIRAECVGRGEQRRIREKAVQFLAARDDIESQVLCVELFGVDVKHDAALDTALGILESAVTSGAARTAHRALSVAEVAVPHADPGKRAVIESYRERLAGSWSPKN